MLILEQHSSPMINANEAKYKLDYGRISVYIVQLRNEGKIQGFFEVSK